MRGYLIQHYVEQSAGENPRKTAITHKAQAISYSELWELSGKVADNLVKAGFSPRNPVCIYMHKSIPAVVSMLGVLRAGGTYIPLDSHYSPLSRISRIIGMSGSEYLVSDLDQWEGLASYMENGTSGLPAGMKVLLTNTMSDSRTGHGTVKQTSSSHDVRFYDGSIHGAGSYDSAITDDDTAYVLYTSGSTGVPKGVMLSHRNARTFIDWAISFFSPTAEDVFSNIAPLHFDLSVFDVYVALASSATVKLVPHETSMNPRALKEWIRDEAVTCFYSVPSVWVSMMSHAKIGEGDFPTLSRVLFAGEVFPQAQLYALMKSVPNARFYNLYGPTETNVCTCHEVKSAEEVLAGPVPIGRACANTEVLVLKDNDEPASKGEEGELLVKGSIVTRGYYGNPERTACAFRRSPLRVHDGAMFYKTGDIVRVLEPGLFAYVGRKDLMVKCSGFRIELQEIEHAIASHPDVREAIAVPVYCDDGGNATHIAAFVVAARGTKPGILGIKEHVAGMLPRYMVPEEIVVLDEMPRNANGKADRQELASRATEMERARAAKESS